MRVLVVALAVFVCFVTQATCASSRDVSPLPTALTDDEFWGLSRELSEPAGTFAHSENLVSNEIYYARSIRLLRAMSGVYIGVGPEQNFSYLTRLRSPMAFIVDIRRENRDLHLLYKVLFEISTDRVDFVSRLFSRERPRGLGSSPDVDAFMEAFAAAPPSRALFDNTNQLVRDRLTRTHRFSLTAEELDWISHALAAFYAAGPAIKYQPLQPGTIETPSYRDLMTARDIAGEPRSYLASDDHFAFVKDLQSRNMIVPVIGDFAGPRALRSIGEYLQRHGVTLAAFYGSNVEVYLSKQQKAHYCTNLRGLPYDWRTWFIASQRVRPLRLKLPTCERGDPLR
jgi:hypothetical protein